MYSYVNFLVLFFKIINLIKWIVWRKLKEVEDFGAINFGVTLLGVGYVNGVTVVKK